MTTINISLSSALQHFALNKTQERGFRDESDYIENLVKQDKEQEEADEKFRQFILEGFDSGEPVPITPQYWKEKKARLLEEYNNK